MRLNALRAGPAGLRSPRSVAPYARTSVAAEVPAEQRYLFYAMYCLCLAGLAGITVTGDAFNIFVFLEISSLSSYVLIALGRDRRALLAAYQYLILGTIGATFIVIGVGLLYLVTGTLNLRDIAARIGAWSRRAPCWRRWHSSPSASRSRPRCFRCTCGCPAPMRYAPSAVSAFLAADRDQGVALCPAAVLLHRIRRSLRLRGAADGRTSCWCLSIAAMFVASAAAIFQSDFKHMLAYSSIGQIGYITLGISFASTTGLTGGIVHLFNHGVTKGALFMLAGALALRLRKRPLRPHGWHRQDDAAHLRGNRVGRLQPDRRAGNRRLRQQVVPGARRAGGRGPGGSRSCRWQARCSPSPTCGDSSRSPISGAPSDRWRGLREAPLGLLVPAGLLLVAVVYFGVNPTLTVDAATRAAEALLAGSR